MRRLLLAALATVSLAATFGLPAHAAAAPPATPPKVAIIVGPVGSLTPTYLHLAELAAAAAESGGATVARAYSPNATPGNVLAAVADAHVVIYFGHGYGHPSPYGPLNTGRQNGWGLQGPRAHGTHGDSLGGELAYYGEDWIVANARPAPGFVMIYSNTCYAPGASEGGFAPATPQVAAERVAAYSRKVFAMGGSAYYAVDFDRGAADLVGRILANRSATYGSLFAGDSRYVPSALTTQAHWFSAGQQVWLHRTKYTEGPPNYWYAFAGNPDATPARSWDPIAPTAALISPSAAVVPDAGMRLRLSEPVLGLLPEHVRLVDADGAAVGATVTIEAGGDIVVRPDGPLALSGRYTLQVTPGALDAAGNPMLAAEWPLVTRLDADPLMRDLPVRLEAGSHDLVRYDATWAPAEERALHLTEAVAAAGTVRARLPGREGTWVALRGEGLDGWWVLESARAHVVGAAADARFIRPQTVVLSQGSHPLFTVADGRAVADGELRIGAHPHLVVDRRMVIDGATYLQIRAGAAGAAGRWIAADPANPAFTQVLLQPESRLVTRESRSALAELRLRSGDWMLFRLNAEGAVLDQRTVAGSDIPNLLTSETIMVGTARMFIVADGDHAGWAVREDGRVEVLPGRTELGAPD